MGYRCLDLGGMGAKDAITGITAGGGVGDPGGRDLTDAVPFDSARESTIYEFFPGPSRIDLTAKNLVFELNADGGYHVGAIE